MFQQGPAQLIDYPPGWLLCYAKGKIISSIFSFNKQTSNTLSTKTFRIAVHISESEYQSVVDLFVCTSAYCLSHLDESFETKASVLHQISLNSHHAFLE